MRRRLLAALLGALVAGCAAPQAPPVYPPAAFDHRAADGRVEVYWTCSRHQPNVLAVEGVAQSPWQARAVRFLEVELVGVNAQGRTVDSTRTALPDTALYTTGSSPFRLILPTTGTEARTDLYYQYWYRNRDDGFGFLGRFTEDLQRGFVRDACAPAQHRAG